MGKVLMLFCLLLFSWISVAQTNTIIVPPEAASTEGVGFGGILRSPSNYQVIYGNELFAGSPTDEILITGIAWRIDGLDKGSLEIVIPGMQISASTFLGELMSVSRFPEENWGADRIQALDAQNLHFVGIYDPTLQSFQALVVLDQPFVYDRRAGHLVLDFETSGDYSGSATDWIDVAASPNLRWIGRDGVGSPLLRSGGDVLQISYMPIPEPRTMGIFCIALMAAFLFKRTGHSGLAPLRPCFDRDA